MGLFIHKKEKYLIENIQKHADLVSQKTIRAANIIKVLFEFKEIALNCKYGKFGTIIFPMNFSMIFFTPIFIFLNLLLLFPLTILNPNFGTLVLGLYFVLIIIILMISKSLLLTFIDLTYSLLKAIYQIMFTKIEHDKVEKVISTRVAP